MSFLSAGFVFSNSAILFSNCRVYPFSGHENESPLSVDTEYPLCLSKCVLNYHPWFLVAGSLMNEVRSGEIVQVICHVFHEALPDALGKTTQPPLSCPHHNNLPGILVCLPFCLPYSLTMSCSPQGLPQLLARVVPRQRLCWADTCKGAGASPLSPPPPGAPSQHTPNRS